MECSMVQDCDIQKIGRDIEEIKTALLGNEYNKEGYIEKVNKLELQHIKMQEQIDKINLKIVYWTGAFTATWTIAIFIITKIWK